MRNWLVFPAATSKLHQSTIFSQVISRVAPYVVADRVKPSDQVHYPGDEISVTFNSPVSDLPIFLCHFGLFFICAFKVNCDLPYWFDVVVTANGTVDYASGSQFIVGCLGNSIFVTIGGDDVS
jgi:hypothetical protein